MVICVKLVIHVHGSGCMDVVSNNKEMGDDQGTLTKQLAVAHYASKIRNQKGIIRPSTSRG